VSKQEVQVGFPEDEVSKVDWHWVVFHNQLWRSKSKCLELLCGSKTTTTLLLQRIHWPNNIFFKGKSNARNSILEFSM